MAYKTSHAGKRGETYWYLHCRKCEPRCRPLGAIAASDAERIVQEHDLEEHGRERLTRVEATRALEDFLVTRRISARSTHAADETERYYRATLTPFFASMGERPMRTWRRQDGQRWIEAHPDWSARSRQKFLTVSRTFLAWAKEAHVAVSDWTLGLRAPRIERRTRDPLPPAHVVRLLAAAREHPWLEVPVALAAFAGLSLGDMRSIEWPEVSWPKGRITRPRDKSGRGLDVKITPGLAEVLKRHQALGGPVFRGLPSSSSAVSKAVRELYAAAKVPRGSGEGLHWIRTAFVSLGVQRSGDLAATADLVGDDPATVARWYAQSGRDACDAVVDAVDAALREAGA